MNIYLSPGDPVSIAPDVTKNGRYYQEQDKTWIVQTDEGFLIDITFHEFSAENGFDFLQIGEGTVSLSNQLVSLTGSSLPQELTSSGNALWLRFYSDDSFQRKGFQLTASARINGRLIPLSNIILHSDVDNHH